MASYDGTIKIDSKIDTRGFSSGIKSMTASLRGLAAAVGLAFGVGAVVLFGKSAVSAASELAAAMTGLKSVLDGTGKSFAASQKFINDYIKDGLVPATNAITAYKNLAIRGYSTEQIETTLIALKDSAAFARQSALSMGQAVQGATEGLKNENSLLVDNAGVTKNVSVMWKEYAKSIGTTVESLTKQQKIQAEVAGILRETRFQTGDAAKAAGTYAGMVSALGTSFYNLKVAIGNAIIPVLTLIIPLVKTVVDWLVILFNQFAQLVQVLFGVKLGLDSIAESSQKAADGAEDQAKATDKAKGSLAAFDELNVLDTAKQDSGTPGTPETPGIPAIDPGPIGSGLDSIREKVAAFMAKLLPLLQPAIDAFGRLKEALIPLGETIWSGLKWAWDNILVPLGKWVITDLLPAFLDLLAGAITALNSVIEALKPLGLWLWEKFLKPVGEWVGDAVIKALKWLTDKLYKLSDWIKEHQGTVQTIAIIVGSLAVAFLLVNGALAAFGVVAGVVAGVLGIIGLALSPIGLVIIAIGLLIAGIVLLYLHWDEVKVKAQEVWLKIQIAWGIAKEWFSYRVIDPLKEKFRTMWDSIKEKAETAWFKIKLAWGIAKEWFDFKVIDPIRSFFKNAWEDIKTYPGIAWEAIKKAWEGAKDWFTNTVIDPLKNGFSTALDSIKTSFETVFTGVKDFIRARINDIIAFVNGMITAIASGMNAVISALNSINVTIPSWVPVVGGNSFGISIPAIYPPQVPYLATGAVIPPNAPFAAVLGDQKSGRNIEAPENLIRRIVREESGQGQQKVTIRFEGTLAALVREMKPVIEQESIRVGSSMARRAGA